MWIRLLPFGLATFFGLAQLSAVGSELTEVARLSPGDAAQGFGEGFGASVGIEGDWIVVGAPGDDEFVDGSGAVYVFRRVGPDWVQHDKLKGLGVFEEGAGYSVAIDGDWIVAGAPDIPTMPGGAGVGRGYVFHRDDRQTPADLSDDRWEPAALLNPPPSHLCCRFGVSVDIEANVIVVGMYAGDTGRAYAFHWDGSEWLPDGVLTGSDTEPGDSFGKCVATSGDRIAVGATRDEYPCPGYERCWGAVYVFRRDCDNWLQEDKLVASEATGFGYLVGVGGDLLLASRGTSVHSYRREDTTWIGEGDLNAGEEFLAGALSIGGALAVIGVPSDGSAGPYSGVGFLFRRLGASWIQEAKLAASDASQGDRFGSSTAVGESYAVIGAIFPHPVYVYAVGETLDLAKYAVFQGCFGAASPIPAGCLKHDLEPDGQIDLADHALLLQTFRGP